MSVLVDDVVVFPDEAEPDLAEASLSAAGLSIVGANFGESVLKGTQVKTSVGTILVDREPESRTISLRLRVREDTTATLPEAAARLEAIVAEMQERATWIRRDFHVGGEFGAVLYHVTGEVTLGDFAGWQVGDSPDVALTMVCDFAGYATEEAEHGPFETGAGQRQLVYTLPAGQGTTKGLKRIHVSNQGDEDWRGLIWSEECRDYKPADPTALPHYEAVDLTPLGVAKVSAGPAPKVRAVGAVASGAGAISPDLPQGTQVGDLLVMVAGSGASTGGPEATTDLTAEGWSSPPSPYAAQGKGNTRLTLLYRVATGSDPTTTNDAGDHQLARIIGVAAGTFDAQSPFNTAGVGTQAATKAVSVPGASTTRDNCLVIACASGHLPDASSTTEFGPATNASLAEIVEQIDNAVGIGDGGGIWAVSGVKAAKGAYGATTCTAVTEAERAGISLAVNPPEYVEHASLTAGKLAILGSEIAAVGHMTHRGSRKVWMRLEQPSGAVGAVKLRLLWRALGSSRWVEDNKTVSPHVTGVGSTCLLDLGVCRPQPAVLGEERWEWVLQAWAPGGSGSIRVRDVYALSTEQYLECSEPYRAPVAELQETKLPGEAKEMTGPPAEPGTVEWSNESNALSSNDSYATASSASFPYAITKVLAFANHAFALPQGSKVVDVLVRIEGKCSHSPLEPRGAAIYCLQLLRNGSLAGIDKAYAFLESGGGFAQFPVSDHTFTFGGEGDGWGLTLTDADVNDPDFGVGMQLMIWTQGGVNVTASIDGGEMVVYYTEAEDEDRLCFASRAIELASDGVVRQHQADDVWGRVVPDGFLPAPLGRASRGILIASQGDLGGLPDSGANSLRAVVKTRAGFLYARESP